MTRSDITVVGAGVIGLTIAYSCARRGASVTVYDPDPKRSASRAAAGLLIPCGGRISRAHLALRRASYDLYPDFIKELEEFSGQQCGFRREGFLTLAYGPTALPSLRGLAGCLKGAQVRHQLLDPEACFEMEPALSREVGGGLLSEAAQVDPERVQQSLLEACLRLGASILPERVTSLANLSGQVVVASGSWTAELTKLPVYPVRGQVALMQGPPTFRRDLQLQQAHLYLVNRGDGRVVIGATEEEVGYDASVSREGAARLLSQAQRLVPEVTRFKLLEHRVGWRPKVGDGLPVLGQNGPVYLATGHYRNGILLAPITGWGMAELLLEGRLPPLFAPFTPARDFQEWPRPGRGVSKIS